VGLARGTSRASGRSLTLVQIDAHADLRDEFQSDPYSHACIAQRLLDDGVESVIQFGIRSVCIEEAHVIDSDPRVRVHWADEIHEDQKGSYLQDLAERVTGADVYLTIDVDGLDPAIIPATGTPEPNGLSWRQTMDIIRTTARAANVIGLDVVELAPRPGLHAADFAAAKLTYLAVNLIAESRGWLS
jgi:agmatinase